MSLWYKASGELIKNGSGDLIECATCPCCPSDCSGCSATYTLTLSGFPSPCTFLNSVHTITMTSSCVWTFTDFIWTIGVFCVLPYWSLSVTAGGFATGGGNIPISACPTGTYSITIVTGTPCAGLSGTGVLS